MDFSKLYEMYSYPEIKEVESPKAGRLYATLDGWIVRCVDEDVIKEKNKYTIVLKSILKLENTDAAVPNNLINLTKNQLRLFWVMTINNLQFDEETTKNLKRGL